MTIAITAGEPSGIGPEIAVKAWQALKGEVPLLWIGDPRHLPAGTPFATVCSAGTAARASAEVFPVLPIEMGRPPKPGVPEARLAGGVIQAIEKGVELALKGDVAAICTAPIHKAALVSGAGFTYPGHTEFLAALAGVDRVAMMLACEGLRVVPATIHIALEDVPRRLTAELLEETIRITAAGLTRDFGIAAPRIAIAGLNPHAGEDGVMGRQEIEMIRPLMARLTAEGFTLLGPMPADTMFHAGARAKYDAAICMYHDQALIPIKTIDFAGGVNVTLGLPFIRTSPDHGTAFDIAGQGVADPSSMIAALRLAAKMAAARRKTTS